MTQQLTQFRAFTLVFGSHDLDVTKESLNELRRTLLASAKFEWLLDVITDLPQQWEGIRKAHPALESSSGSEQNQVFLKWLRGGTYEGTFPPPNAIVGPLTVIVHLVQFFEFIETVEPSVRDGVVDSSFTTAGLCTGLLMAAGVGSSKTLEQLKQNGATAIRLAMAIGAFVDAFNVPEWSSLAVNFSSSGSAPNLNEIIARFAKAYIAVNSEPDQVTVTLPLSSRQTFARELASAGFITAETGLRGAFHHPEHESQVSSLLAFFDSNPAFQFTTATLPLAMLPANPDKATPHMSAHEAVTRAMLCDSAEWHALFTHLERTIPVGHSNLVWFGRRRPLPKWFVRKYNEHVLHAADIPNRSAGSLPQQDIAIIGMACHVPGGRDLDEFWDTLQSGLSQHVELKEDRTRFGTLWRSKDADRKWFINMVKDHAAFDHKLFKKTAVESASMDPQQRLIMQVAYQAVQQSGYLSQTSPRRDVGCYIGAGPNDYELNVAQNAPTAYTATGGLRAFLAGKISYMFGWGAKSITLDTACSSSAVAIHEAATALLTGQCYAALAGGTNVLHGAEWFENLAGASFLSQTGQCKPFDADADGYCRAEGAGAFFLKKLTDAINDGDQVLGVIKATFVAQNENCTAITAPTATSLADCFRNVIERSGLVADQITFAEAHGTGTQVGDKAEYTAIHNVFAGPSRTSPLFLGSAKGHIGHLESASGAASLIKTLLQMHNSTIPPQASHKKFNPKIIPASATAGSIEKIRIASKQTSWDSEYKAALINNYGASGSNASIVLAQAPRTQIGQDQAPSSLHVPFCITANSPPSLRANVEKVMQWLKNKQNKGQPVDIANLAFHMSRQTNSSLERKLILCSNSVSDLITKLESFTKSGQEKSVAPVPRNVNRPVILAFGGQVSTTVTVHPDIYNNNTLFRAHIERCDQLCMAMGLPGIRDFILDPDAAASSNKVLQLQLALFSVQYASAQSWIDSGVRVAAVVGHSFGELTAMCVSGLVCLKDSLRAVARRAQIIERSWGRDSGAMLFVEADLQEVRSLLQETTSNAGVACFNGPRAFTIAGTTDDIDGLQRAISSGAFSKLRTRRLDVTNAFHSRLVDPLMPSLSSVGAELIFREPTIHQEWATEDAPASVIPPTDFLATHMRRPVCFSHAVQRLAQRFPNALWLEAGSGSGITNMASKALGKPETAYFQAVNLTSLDGLADATANLWRQGLQVTFWGHHKLQSSSYSPLLLPPYQFEKPTHWLERKEIPTAAIEVAPPAISETPATLPLFTFLGYQSSAQATEARFQIHPSCPEFRKHVSAHVIAEAAPICPTGFQYHIATTAIATLVAGSNGDAQLSSELQELENHSPIVNADDLFIKLTARRSSSTSWSWQFQIDSTPVKSTAKNQKWTMHATGRVTFRESGDPGRDFASYERLVDYAKVTSMLKGKGVTQMVVGSRNIYNLFSPMVHYNEDEYKCLQTIVANETESAGRVLRPASSATRLDVGLGDSFCQVAGIFANCLADCSETELYLSNKLEHWIQPAQLDGGNAIAEFDVYARHTKPTEKDWLSDIFVFNPKDGRLLAAIFGMGFTRLKRASMSKMLKGLTGAAPASRPAPTPIQPQVIASPPQKALVVPVVPVVQAEAIPQKLVVQDPAIANTLREVLCNMIGLEPEDILARSDLMDLGVDSLLAMELARDVQRACNVELDTDALMGLTDFQSLVDTVNRRLGHSTPAVIAVAPAIDAFAPQETVSPASTPSISRETDTKCSDMTVVLKDVLCNMIGLEPEDIEPKSDLMDLGVDSLLAMELARDVQRACSVGLDTDALMSLTDFQSLVDVVHSLLGDPLPAATPSSQGSFNPSEAGSSVAASALGSGYATPASSVGSFSGSESPRQKMVMFEDTSRPKARFSISAIQEAFEDTKALTDDIIEQNKLAGFCEDILPQQDELVLVHIIDAFEELGSPIRTAAPGQVLTRIPHLPKHQQVVDLFYGILRDARVVELHQDKIVRTAVPVTEKSASALLEKLLAAGDNHCHDHKLTTLLGTQLAKCLQGLAEGVQILFGDADNRALVSASYAQSPIHLTMISQLGRFFSILLEQATFHADGDQTVKILELGAGTGGTTSTLLPLLAATGLPIQYTITDLSPGLVAGLRKRFAKQYPFTKFEVVNMENTPPTSLLGSQHIILATNCVHATHDLTNTTGNIRQMLQPGGSLLMIEMTSVLKWVDLVFGLAEGWWLFDDGRTHACIPPTDWETVLRSNGYGYVDWTEGSRPESKIQQVILAVATNETRQRVGFSSLTTRAQQLDADFVKDDAVDALVQQHVASYTPPRPFYGSIVPRTTRTVLITGATGSLGAHLVAHFAAQPNVDAVICLNRPGSIDNRARQLDSLQSRGVSLDTNCLAKLQVLAADTHAAQLGLPNSDYIHLAMSVTDIVHNAWPMSLKRKVRGFSNQFTTMRNLINFARICRQSGGPRIGFQLIGSIATVGFHGHATGNLVVPEEATSARSAMPVGYAEAKLVCERMLQRTLGQQPGDFRTMTVRLGQIAGSRLTGNWNHVEHLARLIKSSQTLQALPDLPGDLSWCPVNDVATVLGEILTHEGDAGPVYNIENPVRQTWHEMIRTLARGLGISNIIPFAEWTAKVLGSGPSLTDEDNPAAALAEFWTQDFVRMSCGTTVGGIMLDTARSKEVSATMRSLGAVGEELVLKYVDAWKRSGFLA